jgi:hypothetical protein
MESLNEQATQRDEALREALARHAAKAHSAPARYEAVKAYWMARGRAEDAGGTPEQAHEMGVRAYALAEATEAETTEKK